MQLSDAQKEAVETINGQVILISCPGSGKTSTVVRRVLHMVQSGVPAEEILVLTFSKAAALEMAERYNSLLPDDLKNSSAQAVFATIHSFCYNVVAHAYNLTADHILKENEAWGFIRKGLDELKRAGVLTMEIRDYVDFTSSCLREISVINNNGVDWETYQAQTCPTKEFHQIYDYYTSQKQAFGKIDFDDMLLWCRQLFKEYPEYLTYYQSRHKYLIIDEYQDTNFLQSEILYMLAGDPETANICVVGDDDQSIYRFRGARPEIMLSFDKTFPSCKKIYMDVNYRSEPVIISHARNLIEYNKDRFVKDIKPNKNGEGAIELSRSKDATKEVYDLISKIEEMHKTYAYEDMAVLYRNNKQANFLSLVLMGKNIPFYSNDPLSSPYRHWIFSDLVAFYKLAQGVGTHQHLVQIINKPNRFINVACLKNVPVDKDSVCKAILRSETDQWKRRKKRNEMDDFFMNLHFLKDTEPAKFLQVVRSFCGYDAYLQSYATYRKMDTKELTGILDSYASDIKTHKITTMEDWFSYAQSVNIKTDQINANKRKTGIALSTMHKSKGLEWPCVFIIGVNEGTIPSDKTEGSVGLEEERRLFYVAVTRAKERLFLSYIDPEDKSSLPSRFIREMNTKKTEKENVTTNAAKNKARKWKKGDKVYDRTYGKGMIVQVSDNTVTVKFDRSPVTVPFSGEEKDRLRFCV